MNLFSTPLKLSYLLFITKKEVSGIENHSFCVLHISNMIIIVDGVLDKKKKGTVSVKMQTVSYSWCADLFFTGWLQRPFVSLDGSMVLWMNWKDLNIQLSPSKLCSLKKLKIIRGGKLRGWRRMRADVNDDDNSSQSHLSLPPFSSGFSRLKIVDYEMLTCMPIDK